MTIWTPLLIFAAGFAAAAGVAWLFRRAGLKTISVLEQEKQELLTEESRMFSFLHEIGENLAHDRGLRRLHYDMAHGIARIVGADGAALYTLEQRAGVPLLMPSGLTKDCVPVVTLPIDRRDYSAEALYSYLQLTPVAVSDGLLGKCLATQTPLQTGPLVADGIWPGVLGVSQTGASMMFAPVTSGKRQLGVLAVVQNAGGEPFTAHEFEVFRSSAEQCAFALASALTQQEAMKTRLMEEEVRSASEVQRVLLRPKMPELSDYYFAASNTPAKVMSGDYYDFLVPDENHLGVLVADVSGKGFPASLVMATCRALVRGVGGRELSPSATLGRVNRMLWGDVREDMFISLVYCMLDRNSPTVTMARAGHDAPLHYIRTTGEVVQIKPPGLALGIDSGKVFERATKDYTFTMEPGDCLLLYTDGVNEAENVMGEQFGMERLTATLKEAAFGGANAVLSAFKTNMATFVNGHMQLDDITILVIERK